MFSTSLVFFFTSFSLFAFLPLCERIEKKMREEEDEERGAFQALLAEEEEEREEEEEEEICDT